MARPEDEGGLLPLPDAGGGSDERARWLEELLHDLDAIVWEADARTWRFTFVGGRAEELLGYTIEGWLANPTFWIDLIHPDDRDEAIRSSREATGAGRGHDFEYRAIAKDGRVVWLRQIVRILPDAEGRPATMRGLMIDVSEHHRTELALRESEERFQLLSDVSLEGVVVHDDGVIVEANRAFAELFGYDRSELIGMRVSDLAAPESLPVLIEHLRSGSDQPYEAVGRRKDGSTFVAALVGRTVTSKGRDVRVVTTRDITEHRLAVEHLREAEARYRTLVEQLPASVFISDAAEGSRVLYMSPNHERITGYPVEEYMADPYFWRDTVHPDDRDWVVAEASRTDTTGEPYTAEYRIVTKDGRTVWVREHTILVRDDDGQPLCWQGVMLDITERKVAEEQVRQAEVRFRTLIEQVPAVVFITPPDQGSLVSWVSPYVEELLGYTEQEAVGTPDMWDRALHPDDREWVVVEAERTDRTGEPFLADYRMIARDGRVVWVREHTTLVRDQEGRPSFWQGAFFDITGIKLAEEELARALAMEREASQRLRLLDEMKTTFLEAVSHDLRTPLTAILGTALTLDRDDLTLPPSETRDLIRRIAANARKLDRLLSDLLDLDRVSRGILEPKRRPVDVSRLVRRLVEGTEALGGRPVEIVGDVVVGVLDAAKVERIVENLLSNAARHTEPDTRIWIRLWRVPEGVMLAVEDEGVGVPEHLRTQVFQPFQQGQGRTPSPGVGIGLSLVARFAEMHGGRAWVEERDGGGASFRVLLPDASDVEPPSPPSAGLEAAEER